MANKVPKFTVSKHSQERNAFDLSQTHLYQAAPGMLYPILALDLIPDDAVKINVADYIKSMPVVNSPLCSARGVYEFFFVPYHQLWHNFDQFITQMSDYRSSYFALPNPPSQVPSFGKTANKNFILSPAWNGSVFSSQHEVFNDVFGNDVHGGYNILSDFLGYGPSLKDSYQIKDGKVTEDSLIHFDNEVSLPDYRVNPFRLAAYQKIYQDYYRKTSYEQFDVNAYSLDNLSTGQISKLIEMRYRNYGLDLLTNIRPSAVLNANNTVIFNNLIPKMFGTDNVISSEVDFDGSTTNQSSVPPKYEGKLSNDTLSNNSDSTFLSPSANDSLFGLSVQSIRAAFALDKLSQLIGRAEKDFKSQMQAVFGVNASTGRDGKCIFIDGFSSDISFGEVDNTNGSSYGNSYSSYGKVFGSGNGNISFKAPEFGVLMCIYSIIPFVPYDSTYVDSFNTKFSYADYFNPLYQRLGLQPLYSSQINTLNGLDSVNKMSTALGWQPRYSEYKTAVDRNHGGFNNYGTLRSFTASRNRSSLDYIKALTLKDFKVSPNVFDSVFTNNVNGCQPASFPFFNKVSFNIVKVSSMDTDSLPLL